MSEKKSVSRFCIQFNEHDIHHQQVIDILHAQGRHKTQFIATAVLHYISCMETPAIPSEGYRLRQTVEAVILDILEKRNITSARSSSLNAAEMQSRKMHHTSETGANIEKLDEDTLSAIQDSLATFRSMGN